MNEPISNIMLSELRKKIHDNLGLNFTLKQEKELFQKISLAAKDFNFADIKLFIDWILEKELLHQEKALLAKHLTIGETYFFREKKIFDFLEQIYLPNLVQKRYVNFPKLKIWCAGCASGEEAYSIAIMLHRTIPNIKNWDISILATDINPDFLEKAEKGIYKKWSFRSSPDVFIDKYFNKTGNNEFSIIPEIKSMVKFSSLNLAHDSYPSDISDTIGMDIIFCRNVFIYFSPEVIKEVTERFSKSLLKGGLLIVSLVEMSSIISNKFGKIENSGFPIYQKGLHKTKEKRIFEWKIPASVKEHVILRPVPQVEPIKQIKPEPQKVIVSEKKEKVITDNLPKFEDAVTLYEKGLFDEAEKILSSLINTDTINSGTIIHLLAKTKANLGKLDEAKNLCENALKKNKLDLSMHFLLATIQLEMGNDAESIASLNKAIYLDGNFVMAHFLLGNLIMRTGGNGNGMKHFKNAMNILSKLNPEDILPESDGLSVGRFTEIINAIKS
ncbi:MAG: CheR family methyltransferase [bacterium]